MIKVQFSLKLGLILDHGRFQDKKWVLERADFHTIFNTFSTLKVHDSERMISQETKTHTVDFSFLKISNMTQPKDLGILFFLFF